MIGKQISHYEILEKLGEGGMGVVYKAHDTKLDRTVALKFLPKHVGADDTEKQRFLNEAKAASALDHTNICSIHAVEEDEDGNIFIVMAFYEGMSLKEKIEQGPLSLKDAAQYSIQIATGLQEAHEKGIVHRDLKPANIFITNKDQVKIIDFGLAKAAQRTMLTKSGTTLGTVPYMSPEQAQGSTVDHRTDIWSLGVVMYEMVTGQLPFKSEYDTALVYSIVNEDPEQVTGLRSGVPMELERIINKCLEKDAGDRYQHVDELIVDLRKVERKLSSGIRRIETIPEKRSESTKDRSLLRSPVVYIIPAVVLLLIGLYLFIADGTDVPARDSSIAVLPLEDLSPDAGDDFFADGIHEDIITNLSTVGDIRVITRGSVMRYTDTPRDYGTIADDLGVTTLLEGTVRRFEDRVRVSVNLIDAESEENLWAGTYDKDIHDLFEIQRELSREISDALHASLTPQELDRLEKLPTENTDAYNFYIQAREYFNRPGINRDNWESAIQLLERAVETDPQFAHAYAELSLINAAMYWFAFDRDRKRIEKAGDLVERALLLDPDLPEAHFAKGNYLYMGYREYERSLEHLYIALEGMPNNSFIYAGIASNKRRLGNWEAALTNYKKSVELDPRHEGIIYNLALTHHRMGNFAEAVKATDRQIELAPDAPREFYRGLIYLDWHGTLDTLRAVFKGYDDPVDRSAYQWWRLNFLDRNWDEALHGAMHISDIREGQVIVLPKEYYIGLTNAMMDETTQAREHFEVALEIMKNLRDESPGDHRIRISLCRVYAALGRPDDAIFEGEKAAELMPIEKDALIGAAIKRHLAVVYARVGETDKAFDTIETLLSIPSLLTINRLKIDPLWDPIRDQQRFQQIIDQGNGIT